MPHLRSYKKSVKLYLGKQAHHRVRGGEQTQLCVGLNDRACRTLFQAQISRALRPVTLSLLSGWSCATKQRECLKKESHLNRQSRCFHQIASCAVCAVCNPQKQSLRSAGSMKTRKNAEVTKSYHCHCKTVAHCHLQHPEEERALQSRALCSLKQHSTETTNSFRGGGYLHFTKASAIS